MSADGRPNKKHFFEQRCILAGINWRRSESTVLEFPFAFARVDEMSHDTAQIGYRETTAVKPLAPE